MNGCERLSSGEIELCFYGELDAHERAAVERHVKGCGECRRALDDLSTIRAALSTRPVVTAPPDGDWTRFMAKLDAAVHIERETVRLVQFGAAAPAKPRVRQYAPLAMAALVTLAAMSVAYVMRSGHRSDAPSSQGAAIAQQHPPSQTAAAQSSSTPAASQTIEQTSEAGFAALSEQHFERSKLVVLGLANKDARHTRVSDWEFERQLASTLLSDTRLYRLAAEDRGYTALARVMGDLELVLLQTSASERPASADLQQIQRLIAKRDLVTKMGVVTAAGL